MFEIPTTRAPRRCASRIAWMVSMVSPLWDTPMTRVPISTMGSR